MNHPTFDVAITTYRRPSYVVAAVKSCLLQGKHLEKVIVVDDGSEDDTEERISQLKDTRIIYYRRLQNGGMSAARHDGLALSKADWTIHLDDDWELLPGAIDYLVDLANQAPQETVMLGARMIWDQGDISPIVVPTEPLDYEGQIRWRSRPDGLWMDNLCAVSKKARAKENWLQVRFGWYCSTLFYLDVARHGLSLYTDQLLAIQKTSMIFSDSRGDGQHRLARRREDAPGGIEVAERLLERHENGLTTLGKPLMAYILSSGAMYHLLLNHRLKAFEWSLKALRINPRDKKAFYIALFAALGRNIFERCYVLRK